MQLRDATVLVTGASAGIGAAAAHLLHERGARLVLHGRDEARLAELAKSLEARVVRADLAEPGAPEQLAGEAGPVDVVVHNAGAGLRAPLIDTDTDAVDQLVRINLLVPMQLTRALLPAMVAAGRGHLAFVASIAGRTGVAQESVYAATKAGLLGFADSLRLELAGTGVTVSTISPGAVDTGFWQARGSAYHRRVPRPISAQRVAELLVADISVGGGSRVVPRWLRTAEVAQALAPRAYRRLAARFDS
jgi:short-subunit dehydrogenase